MPERKNLKGGKTSFGPWFEVWSRVAWPQCFTPISRQKILAVRVWWSKAAHLMVAWEEREQERETHTHTHTHTHTLRRFEFQAPKDLTSPMRPCLLEDLPLPTVPSAED
jgi:hypothetical protein